MPNYICVTCGNQFGASERPPDRCPICEDVRQYVNPNGQTWTTIDAMRRDYHNVLGPLEPGLTEIGTAEVWYWAAGAARADAQGECAVGLSQPD